MRWSRRPSAATATWPRGSCCLDRKGAIRRCGATCQTRCAVGRRAPRVGPVFVFAFTAALNPTLLTAVTVMLTLEKPKRLLLGYLLGAALTAVTCGLLLVFLLPGSSTSSSAKRTVNPILDIVFGLLILLVVFVVATGRDRRRREWS